MDRLRAHAHREQIGSKALGCLYLRASYATALQSNVVAGEARNEALRQTEVLEDVGTPFGPQLIGL